MLVTIIEDLLAHHQIDLKKHILRVTNEHLTHFSCFVVRLELRVRFLRVEALLIGVDLGVDLT